MSPYEMLAIYRCHRAAEDARDYPRVMETLASDCVLEHVSVGLQSVGHEDATRAYIELFEAFPDLGRIPEGVAFGDDVLVAFGQLTGTMKGSWLGLAPTGRTFTIPLVNIVPFSSGLR
jgi:predicted ester cyclase